MPFLSEQWLTARTISNGSCGYHAFAECFLEVATHKPELLNPLLFDPSQIILGPFHQFLCATLDLPLGFNASALSARLKHGPSFHSKTIAAAFFILLLSHYKNAISSCRSDYAHVADSLNQQQRFDAAEYIAQTSLENTAIIQDRPENQIHRTYYLQYLQSVILNFEDEEGIFHRLKTRRRQSVIADFLENRIAHINTVTALEFIHEVCHIGFSAEEYPTISLINHFNTLAFKPIAVECDPAGVNISIYYPVIVMDRADFALNDHPASHKVIAAVFHLGFSDHFEYALSPTALAYRTAQKEQPALIPTTSARNVGEKNKSSRHFHEEQRQLKELRILRHQEYMKKNSQSTPVVEDYARSKEAGAELLLQRKLDSSNDTFLSKEQGYEPKKLSIILKKTTPPVHRQQRTMQDLIRIVQPTSKPAVVFRASEKNVEKANKIFI